MNNEISQAESNGTDKQLGERYKGRLTSIR
jgi:hypothetical protein